VPNGGGCTTPAQCASTFCVTGVCCDTPCDEPGQTCKLPGRAGECLEIAPAGAPTLSPWGLAMAGIALIGLAAMTLKRLAR
jgi:hypothetical protein